MNKVLTTQTWEPKFGSHHPHEKPRCGSVHPSPQSWEGVSERRIPGAYRPATLAESVISRFSQSKVEDSCRDLGATSSTLGLGHACSLVVPCMLAICGDLIRWTWLAPPQPLLPWAPQSMTAHLLLAWRCLPTLLAAGWLWATSIGCTRGTGKSQIPQSIHTYRVAGCHWRGGKRNHTCLWREQCHGETKLRAGSGVLGWNGVQCQTLASW